MLIRRPTRCSFVFLCLVSLAVTAWAQEAARQTVTGRLVEISIPAPSLKGNLLGDPLEQKVTVYLPPSYESSPAKRYPTLYLLHGFFGRNNAWTSGAYQGLNIQPVMDEMIKTGKVREMIIVAPSGWNTYGGGFYTNSTVTGNWEDYIYRDLIGNIDANYRTIARAESRGVAGHSMGGYGAISLGMKHPDIFTAVYALSPCCLMLDGDMGVDNPAWSKVNRLTGKDQLKMKPESFDEFFTVVFVALSAAFSPNPTRAPFFVDFPFQEREGRLEKNESAYNRWRSKMPVYMVDENKQNLMKLRGLFIDYGEKEEFSHIRTGCQLFSKALAERNIPHGFEVYKDGDHGSKISERVQTRVLEFFSEKLVF
jgi:S-formylglutathione hydrolase FrmB